MWYLIVSIPDFCTLTYFENWSLRKGLCALWSSAGKRLTSWLSFVVSNCEFVTQVWYLIVSIPDLCTLTYLKYRVGVNMFAITFMPIASFDELLFWMRCRQLLREAREAAERLIVVLEELNYTDSQQE